VAGTLCGFASRTKQSKNGPVAPSARNQSRAGAVTPAEPWPAANGCVGLVRYIARSTMIGLVAVISADTSVFASSLPSSSTGMVFREFGSTVY
jgi:hypothetical protein